MSQLVTIVDTTDREIWAKAWGQVLTSDIYRVSALWIVNSQNEVLIAQRQFTKKRHPWLWGVSIAWTVEVWETYESNIHKEAFEELWLENISPVCWPKLFSHKEYTYFIQLYFLRLDKKIEEFILQQQEVASIKWVHMDDLRKKIQENPWDFTPSTYKWFQALCTHLHTF